MTLEEALRIAAQAVFLWVAFITLLIWLRRRDKTRRDIFFVFLSFAIAIIAQELMVVFPRLSPALTVVLLIALLAQPYLVLRVARYLLPVSVPVQRAALAGLLFTSAAVLAGYSTIASITVLVVVYFLLVEGFATLLLIRGARLIPGMSGRRLRLAAIGSGLSISVFLMALAAFLWTTTASAGLPSLFEITLRLLTMVSGLSYFLGFTPPHWLLRAWQLNELRAFLHRLSADGQRPAAIFEHLASAGMRALPSVGVLIVRSSFDGSYLTPEIPGEQPATLEASPAGSGDILQAWREKRSRLVQLPGRVEPQIGAWLARTKAQALYLLPVIGSIRPWGMLIVALPSLPLFAEDDLALLDLFCEQSVTHLDQAALVERLEHANQELQERVAEQSHSEERFRRLLESAPDGMVIIDDAGTLLMSNTQAGRHFGYRPDELVGKSLESLFPPASSGYILNSHSALLRQPPERPVIIPAELNALRRDGNIFPVEVSLNPILTSEGSLTIVAVHDLTRRFHAEQKFRGLLESAPDAVVVVDQQGRIQLVNSQAEKMFGFGREEILGRSIEMLVPKRFHKKHVRHREVYYQDHPARPMGAGLDLYAVRKNGTEFPVEISLSPLEFEDGLLVSAAIRDVTRRKQTEEEIRQLNADLQQRASQLEAANQELESFSYSVSHDLRAPLRSIDGFSQALLEDYADQLPEEGRGYLQRVRSAAQRMADLIDDLLNLSRVTRASLRPRFMNLSQVAEDSLGRLREQEPDRQVEVLIVPDMMVTGDPHLLQIVMENLMSNAWKFTSRREHARIEFGQQNHSGQRTFFVRDNGVGFSMAYVDKLFGVFQRLHSVSDYPGTGVGLATVQRIIRIHGGRIWAESAEGRGTTFFFTL